MTHGPEKKDYLTKTYDTIDTWIRGKEYEKTIVFKMSLLIFLLGLSIYKHRTEKLSPHLFSPLDPIVNVSHKNGCVGSFSKIFHPNMMLIYNS